jgi:hypothetical protein
VHLDLVFQNGAYLIAGGSSQDSGKKHDNGNGNGNANGNGNGQ